MWEQIRSNQRRSAILVVVMAALLFLLGYFLMENFAPGSGRAGIVLAFLVWMMLSLVSYFGGGGIFLAMSGARRIEKQDFPRLFNVVEEMTIASGLPRMPDIYVIDDPAPNAFATGRNPSAASVAVTSGLLSIMDRDELQGVIAHELGHVRNRDTLYMLMVGVMLGAIVFLADVGLRRMFWGGRSRRRVRIQGGGQAQAVILIVAILLMILAPIMARLIYYAVSRRREYLADASSALFTRYPEGLASALEKIGASTATLASANRATAPMYTVNPLKPDGSRASDITSTHPPISERIRILRAMAGASFLDYERAYKKLRGGARVVPGSALSQAKTVPVRQASGEKVEKKDRVREATDLLWKLNKYLFLACACGTRLKIPPGFPLASVNCPHCGRLHQIAAASPSEA